MMQETHRLANLSFIAIGLLGIFVACGRVASTESAEASDYHVLLTFNPFGNPRTFAQHLQDVKRDETTSVNYCRGVVRNSRVDEITNIIQEGERLEHSHQPFTPGSFVTAVLYFPDGSHIIIRGNNEAITRNGVVYRQSDRNMIQQKRILVEMAIEGGCEVYEQDLRDYLAFLAN